MELRKYVVPEIVYGEGARLLVARYIRNLGARKILLVTDEGIAAAGWVDEILRLLEAEGIPAAVYDAVTPNPLDREVMAGAAFYREAGCDVIVALGGGSPIDCAKSIGIVSTNDGTYVLEFEGVDRIPTPGPPLICIPTTAGSSADVSQFAVITDARRQRKKVMVSKTLVPDLALIDPVVTTTMDRERTAATGMDALAHAVEAFVSTAGSPITDLLALNAIRLVRRHLRQALEAPQDLGGRDGMMQGSLQAGMAFSNASLGLVHAMAHALAGRKDMAHGESNALLLSHVVRFNFDASPEKYTQIGTALGLDFRSASPGEKRRMLSEALDRLREGAGLAKTLRDCGIEKGEIPEMAREAMQDPCIITNPKRPGQRDIEVIYEEAF